MKKLTLVMLTLYAILFAIIFLYSSKIMASEQLVLETNVSIQRQDSSGNWKNIEQKSFEGLSGVQYYFDKSEIYRLVVTVVKPYDLEGVVRVRMATRADGKVTPNGDTRATVIFGPQSGCQGNEERCKPLSIDDVGLVEVRLDVEKANFTGLSSFLLRPFENRSPIKIRPSITFKDKNVPCGTTIDKGFWIFSAKLVGNGSKVDTISICVTNPKGKIKCADDQDLELKVRASKKGLYTFNIFDDRVRRTRCEVYAV